MALPSVRVLKAAIVIMGIAIVLVLGAIVTLMVRKVTGASTTSTPIGTTQVAVPQAIGPISSGTITLPAGAAIESEVLDGRRVLLRLRLPDGSRKFQMIDLDGGKTLGEFEIRQAAQ